MGELRWEFDFRPPNRAPNALSVPWRPAIPYPDPHHPDEDWIEGCATVVQKGEDEWSVGIYIWRGNVEEAAKAEMEKILGFKLRWKEYGGGNGHEGGTLVREVT